MTLKEFRQVCDLVADYKEDPNCWAELWISDIELTSNQKELFMACVSKKPNFVHFGINLRGNLGQSFAQYFLILKNGYTNDKIVEAYDRYRKTELPGLFWAQRIY